MLLVGLTGGIGSGKSTVATGLADRGSAIVDADLIAREVVEPGGAAYAGLVEHFGESILGDDGRLDRPALAAVAFANPEELKVLNSITHPAIAQVMAQRISEVAATHRIVVVDIPLLTIATMQQWPLAAVMVVDTPVETAIARLVDQRGFAEDDARARVAAQISREERIGLADVVLDNSGDLQHLEAEISRAWEWLLAKAQEAEQAEGR